MYYVNFQTRSNGIQENTKINDNKEAKKKNEKKKNKKSQNRKISKSVLLLVLNT